MAKLNPKQRGKNSASSKPFTVYPSGAFYLDYALIAQQPIEFHHFVLILKPNGAWGKSGKGEGAGQRSHDFFRAYVHLESTAVERYSDIRQETSLSESPVLPGQLFQLFHAKTHGAGAILRMRRNCSGPDKYLSLPTNVGWPTGSIRYR